jgi:hypothetical protein
MAQEIDSRGANFAWQNASNIVGALGTNPTSIPTYYGYWANEDRCKSR